MNGSFDIAVIGSGFAGSLLASIARRLGRSVVLVERGSHPRFVIGESSSPLANLLLEELCDRYGLDRIRPLAKWGSWQRSHPQIACGLKRGFTFYAHRAGEPFGADPERQDQLLVAASPHNEIADTHWYRPQFDHFLVDHAAMLGVEYLDRTELTGLSRSDSWRLEGSRNGARVSLRARFLVDASGPGGFLRSALRIPDLGFPGLSSTQALYTHFSGVRRLADIGLFESAESPPYPVDDAAVHHVFSGGWIWVLRFNNGSTSAGVAASSPLSQELRLEEKEAGWRRLLDRFPTIREQFRGARPELPFFYTPRLPFRAREAAGPGWALLPSAAAFVDPLLSTGFPLTLLGIERLADAIEKDSGRVGLDERLFAYSAATLADADTAALLIAALYASFSDFSVFTGLSLLYFAASSFAESARRLGKPRLAESFLFREDPEYGPEFRSLCRTAIETACGGGFSPQGRHRFIDRVRKVIEPRDVAGLSDSRRRNWYPIRAADLLRSARKLCATPEEIAEMLERCGFGQTPVASRASF